MNPWILGRSCEGTGIGKNDPRYEFLKETGTVKNDDRATETEKTEVEDDSVLLAVNVDEIEWPDDYDEYLPWEMTLNVLVKDDDTLGGTIAATLEDIFGVSPKSFSYNTLDDDEDEETEAEDEPAEDINDNDFLDDLIEAVSRPTTPGRVFAVLGILADHGLIPTDEETPTDEEEEDECEGCDDDCDHCPYNVENPTENEENKVGLDDDYIRACADFFNELANLVKQSKSKDTDK